MNYRQVALALVLIAVAVGSFAATYAVRSGTAPALSSAPATQPAPDPLLAWLNLPASDRDPILAHDPAFAADLRRLRSDLASRREELAAALEQPSASDDDIRQRSESVLAASNALERRVTSHLLLIRHHLSPQQQRQLFSLCAQGLRQGPGWRFRGGAGPTSTPAIGPRNGRGPGPHGPRFGQAP